MFRIAACDDDPAELDALARVLSAYLDVRPELDGDLATFDSGTGLLEAVAAGAAFDLFVLDIIMPGENGIEVGRALRDAGQQGEIIYLTASTDYAIDSYDVRAFHYLLKPIEPERLADAIDRAAACARRRRAHSITVSTHGGARRIIASRILYAERVGRSIRYYCTDGIVNTQTIRASFKSAVSALTSDARFQLAGASFLVNLEHVVAVTGQMAVLDDGTELPLPRTAASAFKSAWGRFWLEGDRP